MSELEKRSTIDRAVLGQLKNYPSGCIGWTSHKILGLYMYTIYIQDILDCESERIVFCNLFLQCAAAEAGNLPE